MKLEFEKLSCELCVCVCSIFDYHRHHLPHFSASLSLSVSLMGSSNSRLGSRPSRPRVNVTNRSKLFSLICGGSTSRATRQVHSTPPSSTKPLICYFYYQYPSSILNLKFKFMTFGLSGIGQSVPKIGPIYNHHQGNVIF